MLEPKEQKYRKQQKGRSRNRKKETKGTEIAFGDYGLQALSDDWVNSSQIEAGRKAITNKLEREGRVWIRIFPDKPVTSLPPEVKMGGGKGEVDRYVFPVKPGRVLFEVGGVDKELAEEALNQAGYKMPVKTRFIERGKR
ncbi:MAG: 50S ribosomal protein L16 [Candidatus Magasanikbacteria bacterium]